MHFLFFLSGLLSIRFFRGGGGSKGVLVEGVEGLRVLRSNRRAVEKTCREDLLDTP